MHLDQSNFIILDNVIKSIMIKDMEIKLLEMSNGFLFSNSANNNAAFEVQSITME